MAYSIYSDEAVVVGTTYSTPVKLLERDTGISFHVITANKTGSFSMTAPIQVSNVANPGVNDWFEVSGSSIGTITTNTNTCKAYDYNVTSYKWARVKVVVSADTADISILVQKKAYTMGKLS